MAPPRQIRQALKKDAYAMSGLLGGRWCGFALVFRLAFRPRAADAAEGVEQQRGSAPRDLMKIVVTEAAMATIAQTGETRPVAASGMPMPLKVNASATLVRVRR